MNKEQYRQECLYYNGFDTCLIDVKDALEGVRVVELGGYAAGPCIGKYLANFGAQVLHVESTQHPDGFRLQYPPYKDGKVGVNRSGCFAFFSDSKRGVTVNLKNPKGLELGYRLMDWADILIENMRPGVVTRMGFGYACLRKRNAGLIMLSTSNLGQTGPFATHPGFGSQLSSLSGFCHLIGEPDEPPHMLYGPYIDFIAVAYGGAAVLAALDYRRRTGDGVYIDLSQFEAGLQFISGALLDYSANGVIAGRDGNRDPVAVPHGAFPCAGGEWCVISCWDDDEWERLARAAVHEDWIADARFASAAKRKDSEAALERLVSSWTCAQSSDGLMQTLQRAGVHSAKVNTMRDLFSDPQIAFRKIWQEQEHPEMGRHHYRMVSYQLSEAPGSVRGPAPCLGEHNEEAFRDWLQLSETEYREFEAQGAFC